MLSIPLINKIPQLFEFAAKNMTKHETYNWQYNNRNMGAINMFNNLQSMFAGGMMMQQQPQPAYQQPMMQQTPFMGGASSGYPVSNGFGYPGASVANPAFNQGYQPGAPGFAYTPNVQAATAPAQATVTAPEAPKAPSGETTVTQNVSV